MRWPEEVNRLVAISKTSVYPTRYHPLRLIAYPLLKSI